MYRVACESVYHTRSRSLSVKNQFAEEGSKPPTAESQLLTNCCSNEFLKGLTRVWTNPTNFASKTDFFSRKTD
jgi:hypothetical protein